MLLWMFDNLFYTSLILGFLFSVGGITLFQIIQPTQQSDSTEYSTSRARRLALVIITCVTLVPAIIGFVLALYADYQLQGTIINHWASAFIVGVVLIALLYSAIPSVSRWLGKRIKKE